MTRSEIMELTAEWQDMAANDFEVAQQYLAEGDLKRWQAWYDLYVFAAMVARMRLFRLIGNGEDT